MSRNRKKSRYREQITVGSHDALQQPLQHADVPEAPRAMRSWPGDWPLATARWSEECAPRGARPRMSQAAKLPICQQGATPCAALETTMDNFSTRFLFVLPTGTRSRSLKRNHATTPAQDTYSPSGLPSNLLVASSAAANL